MVQFNLLPDVKLEYIKARRVKRLVILGSVGTSGVVLAIVALLAFFVFVTQRLHLNNLNRDVSELSQELRGIDDIDKILTVQNQLNSLTALHEANPETARIVSFLQQVTPQQATVEQLVVDFDNSKITISGEADDFSIVNKYVDTLKFTIYTVQGDDDGESEKKSAFPPSQVVLASFGRTENGFGYTIEFEFDPTIFDNTLEVTLDVPSTITTRSITERPESLFDENSPEVEQ